ncbi:hypothetical protein GQ457_04G018060 [Hibiscus cannabinus]
MDVCDGLGLWSIWLARNDRVFNGKVSTANDIMFYTKLRALMWVKSIPNLELRDEARWWAEPRSWIQCKGTVQVERLQSEDPFGFFHLHGAVEGSRASFVC